MREGTTHAFGDHFTPIGGVGADGVYRALPLEEPVAFSADQLHAPAANTAAVLTWGAGGADQAHVLNGVAFSYAGAGTLAGGRLTIADGSITVLDIDISSKIHDLVTFDPPQRGTPNRAMTVTLAAGGADVSGKVNALGHRLMQFFSSGAFLNFNDESNSGLLPLAF